MGARTGRQYIEALREQPREVWLRGERVKDVTTHPGLASGVRAIAARLRMPPESSAGVWFSNPLRPTSSIICRTRSSASARGIAWDFSSKAIRMLSLVVRHGSSVSFCVM